MGSTEVQEAEADILHSIEDCDVNMLIAVDAFSLHDTTDHLKARYKNGMKRMSRPNISSEHAIRFGTR